MTKEEFIRRLIRRAELWEASAAGPRDRGMAAAYREAAELAECITSESSGPAGSRSDANQSAESESVDVSAGR